MKVLGIVGAPLQRDQLERSIERDWEYLTLWVPPEHAAAGGWWGRPRRLAAWRASVTAALDEQRPDVLVMMNDRPWPEAVAVQTAHRRGVPSVLLQDGFVPAFSGLRPRARGVWMAQRVAHRAVPYIGAPQPGMGRCDYVGLLGERWRGVLRSRTRAPGTERVVGQPLWDDVFAAAAGAELDPSAYVLYLASDHLGGLRDVKAHRAQQADVAAVREVLNAAGETGRELRVRPHPSDSDQAWADVMRPGILIDRETPLDRAITGSALALGGATTALLAAVGAGWPALVFGPRSLSATSVRVCLPCEAVHDDDSLHRWLRELRSSAAREHLVAENAHRAGGYVALDPPPASLRARDLIAAAVRAGAPTHSR